MAEVWKVEGKDGFDLDAGYYPVSEHSDYEAALKAARSELAQLDISQPDAGGPAGIQDRVYIVHPDGQRKQVYS
jgi:hypothetical protein